MSTSPEDVKPEEEVQEMQLELQSVEVKSEEMQPKPVMQFKPEMQLPVSDVKPSA